MHQRAFLTLLILSSTLCKSQNNVQFADSIRKAHNIPELNYAVVTGNAVLEMAALGNHSVLLNDTATLSDRFHLGSMTKAMTAFVAAKYVEKGKLQWADKFFDYFPDWKSASNPTYYNITLQDLLSHRAHIQPYRGNNDPKIPDFKGSTQEKRTSFGQFVLTLEPIELQHSQQFSYSNAGYTLAALMLEKVSKMSWEQLIEKVFNKHLKLDVQFTWPENQNKKDTWGHIFTNDSFKPVPSNTEMRLTLTEPAGDLNMSLYKSMSLS